MVNSVTGGPTGDTSLSQSLLNSDATSIDITQQMVDAVDRFEAMQSSFQTDMRVQYTLNGIDSLARYLVGIPGRKNVIWYSGSFPLDVQPDPNEEDPEDSVVRNDELLRETDNLLTRAQISMYPVDARGLQTDPSQNFFNEATNPSITGTSGQDAATSTSSFLQQTAQEQLTMQAMAEDTGGQAYVNTSGLTQAVTKAIENGSNYYTLTYSPTNTAWDGRFRTIKIKVDQSGREAQLSKRLLRHRSERPQQGVRTAGGSHADAAHHHGDGHDAWRAGPRGDTVQGAHSPRGHAA